MTTEEKLDLVYGKNAMRFAFILITKLFLRRIFYFPFDGDSFSFCKTNHAVGFGPLVYGLFYFFKALRCRSGIYRRSKAAESQGRKKTCKKAVFPELFYKRFGSCKGRNAGLSYSGGFYEEKKLMILCCPSQRETSTN